MITSCPNRSVDALFADGTHEVRVLIAPRGEITDQFALSEESVSVPWRHQAGEGRMQPWSLGFLGSGSWFLVSWFHGCPYKAKWKLKKLQQNLGQASIRGGLGEAYLSNVFIESPFRGW